MNFRLYFFNEKGDSYAKETATLCEAKQVFMAFAKSCKSDYDQAGAVYRIEDLSCGADVSPVFVDDKIIDWEYVNSN